MKKVFLIFIIIISFFREVSAENIENMGIYPLGDVTGVIAGKVYVDKNDNGKQDEGEPGVEGVVIILENGTSVTTGPGGKYSITNMTGGFHVLELDDWTLPPGIILALEEERTKFVRVTENGIALVNFRVKEDL
ncbi:MAG TPA: SdrD B-like domain-containing protein [Candidatus Eremiobacteraeota bacterium]|nr:MAG: hypothetical protein BWY64_04041 [bacterium ADurb.Bin363]HPZ08478.1 SdrD B-like domain-containing protein [Candidatus Eremiobacteraeota bacterium]